MHPQFSAVMQKFIILCIIGISNFTASVTTGLLTIQRRMFRVAQFRAAQYCAGHYTALKRSVRYWAAQHRIITSPMIEIYKIATAKHDIHWCPKLNLRSSVVSDIETRGNMYKLIPVRCKYVLRKIFLTNHAVCIWNSLPNNVVSAESDNIFKSRLDRFWSLHDFVYNYRASPLDTGSYMWIRL